MRWNWEKKRSFSTCSYNFSLASVFKYTNSFCHPPKFPIYSVSVYSMEEPRCSCSNFFCARVYSCISLEIVELLHSSKRIVPLYLQFLQLLLLVFVPTGFSHFFVCVCVCVVWLDCVCVFAFDKWLSHTRYPIYTFCSYMRRSQVRLIGLPITISHFPLAELRSLFFSVFVSIAKAIVDFSLSFQCVCVFFWSIFLDVV